MAIGAGDPSILDTSTHRLNLLAAAPFASGALYIFREDGHAALAPKEEEGLRFLARQAEWLISGADRGAGAHDPVAQELSHRIKNIFSVIAGLIGLSASQHPELGDLVADLRQRVLALGRAHDFVRPEGLRSPGRTRLCGLLRQLFAPYEDLALTRIRIEGEDPEIDDRSATPLALIFHELATNAAKYGALSYADGTIALSIGRDGRDWRIYWEERGGQHIRVPDGTGFGSQLIMLSLERQLGGRIDREWRSTGLCADIRIPADAMSRLHEPG